MVTAIGGRLRQLHGGICRRLSTFGPQASSSTEVSNSQPRGPVHVTAPFKFFLELRLCVDKRTSVSLGSSEGRGRDEAHLLPLNLDLRWHGEIIISDNAAPKAEEETYSAIGRKKLNIDCPLNEATTD